MGPIKAAIFRGKHVSTHCCILWQMIVIFWCQDRITRWHWLCQNSHCPLPFHRTCSLSLSLSQLTSLVKRTRSLWRKWARRRMELRTGGTSAYEGLRRTISASGWLAHECTATSAGGLQKGGASKLSHGQLIGARQANGKGGGGESLW